ncbi:MAG: hypothetical protein GC145_18615 [Caulobacter sp.]|nr:hypothetical protein [Caulobacter sp.]
MTERPDKADPAPQAAPRAAAGPDRIDRFGYVDGVGLRVVERADPPGEPIDFSSVLNRPKSPPQT